MYFDIRVKTIISWNMLYIKTENIIDRIKCLNNSCCSNFGRM